MHTLNHKNQETYPESLSNLKLFKLLDFHNQRFSLLFSFDLQVFLVSGHFLDSNYRLLRWKAKSKKTLLFLSSLCLMKVLSILSFSFSFLPKMCSLLCISSKMTIFQRLVLWREKTLMGSLGSYEKLVGLRSFSWIRRGT